MPAETERLAVDTRATDVRVPDSELYAWASERSVFVSSLIGDMRAERAAVRKAIEDFGARPVMFEHDLGGQDVTADVAYLDGVLASDIYVGVFGPRYGVPLSSRYSATEAEFLEAESRGLRMALFVQEPADFVGGMRNAYTTSPWSESGDLAERVRRRLIQIASEDLAPWVRLGNLVFRVREIEHNGSDVRLVADIRSPAMHVAIQDIAANRRSDLTLVAPGVMARVQAVRLSTQTQSTTTHRETIDLRITGQVASEVSFGTVHSDGRAWNPAELTEAMLSDALVGTSMSPRNLWMQQQADPLEPMRGLKLPESAVRPIAELLVTEFLAKAGAVRVLERFRLSPRRGESRTVEVDWVQSAQARSGSAGSRMSVKGLVQGI
jgi:hypothetical protein